MASFSFKQVNVFSVKRFGGNPLVVFPHADALTSEQMALIAHELGYSETCFFSGIEKPVPRLRIFTPAGEIPFAGHPTLGSAFVLSRFYCSQKSHLSLLLGVGEIAVTVDELTDTQGFFWMEQPTPEVSMKCTKELFPELGDQAVFLQNAGLVHNGLRWLMLEWNSLDALALLSPQDRCWSNLSRTCQVKGIYHFVEPSTEEETTVQLTARMFAPLLGVPEDPATGSAAGAVAGFIAHRKKRAGLALTISQGNFMQRESLLKARFSLEHTVTVGGAVQLTGSGDYYF